VSQGAKTAMLQQGRNVSQSEEEEEEEEGCYTGRSRSYAALSVSQVCYMGV
jgi:hypothetical protein